MHTLRGIPRRRTQPAARNRCWPVFLWVLAQRKCSPIGSTAPSEARSKPRLCAAVSGLALSLPKASAKQRPCRPVSGLALSVIASRCHLSQSERPWQSAKFAVQHFTPCCRKGSRQALCSDFTPLPRAPTLGELDAVRRPERARMLAGTLRLCSAQRSTRLRGRACWREPCAFVWHSVR